MTLYSKIKRRILNNLGSITTAMSKISIRMNGVTYGSNLRIRGFLKIYNDGNIVLGNNVTINSALWANPISAATRTCFQVSGGVFWKLVIEQVFLILP